MNELSYISTVGMVSEATKKLFSFLFSTLLPIKIFTASEKPIVAKSSPLARHEPAPHHRIALKWKYEHQNPAANIPSCFIQQTYLDPGLGRGKQLHMVVQPFFLDFQEDEQNLNRWAEASIPLRLIWLKQTKNKGASS